MKYELHYSQRKTLELRILGDGTLVVKAPEQLKTSEIDAFVIRKQAWIDRKLKQQIKRSTIPALDADTIEQLREQTRLKADAWLDRWSGPLPTGISVRDKHTSWGSCSGRGHVSLNIRMALLPSDLFDYVMVHEICHLTEMNHSSRFWQEVERYLPNYKELRSRLKNIQFL